MQRLFEDGDSGPASGGLKRAVVIAGSVVLTALALFIALLLGATYFKFRQSSAHERRLERLLERKPTLEQVVEALRSEGSPLLESPEGERELRRAAGRWRDQKKDEIIHKGRRWPKTRVFRAGDMVYFIYFDATGMMSDFTCVSH